MDTPANRFNQKKFAMMKNHVRDIQKTVLDDITTGLMKLMADVDNKHTTGVMDGGPHIVVINTIKRVEQAIKDIKRKLGVL